MRVPESCDGRIITNYKNWDLPGGPMVKNLPAGEGDMGLSPGLGKSHMPQSN